MNGQNLGGETSWIAGLVVGALIICLMAAAYGVGWSQGRRNLRDLAGNAPAGQPAKQGATGAAQKPKQAPAGPGKQLFADSCGSCHTLSAAGTSGTIGPNLDQLGPSAAVVLAAEQNGGAGSGAMPKGLYTGKQAQEVADYVAQASGN
jgi:mono/diheme cytochrome c family protein